MEILKLEEKIRKCKKCSLYKLRINAVPGESPENAVIMFCGQAPGRTEDKEGRPFVGRAGKLLDALLKSIKLCRKFLLPHLLSAFHPIIERLREKKFVIVSFI